MILFTIRVNSFATCHQWSFEELQRFTLICLYQIWILSIFSKMQLAEIILDMLQSNSHKEKTKKK